MTGSHDCLSMSEAMSMARDSTGGETAVPRMWYNGTAVRERVSLALAYAAGELARSFWQHVNGLTVVVLPLIVSLLWGT